MERKHWTLLILAAANGQSLTPVQLQKSLFLVGQFYPAKVGENFYQFTPYNYGPFDSNIYDDAYELAGEGLARIKTVVGENWNTYSATPKGIEVAQSIMESSNQNVLNFIKNVVDWIMPFVFFTNQYLSFPE